MQDVQIEGTPFSVLMQQAVKLKSESGKPFRRHYDALPRYVQESMFATEQTVERRLLPFEGRYEASCSLNEEGKRLFKGGDFGSSMVKFQEALSLWHYVENTLPDWRKKEIEDESLEETVYHPANEEEREQLGSLKERLLCNLSRTHQRMGDGVLALAYLNEVLLRVNERSVKALLRRAELKLTNPSAGGLELKEAWEDVKTCRDLDPENKDVLRLWKRVSREVKRQREADRGAFSNMFERGSIITEEDERREEELRRERKQKREEEDREVCVFHFFIFLHFIFSF